MVRRSSIKRKLLVFLIFFIIILVAGSVAFIVSMQNIISAGKTGELRQMLEVERIKLESSINGEIALVLKMAGSPLIQQYFAHPNDPSLEKIAFEEIAEYRHAFSGNTIFWINDIDKKFYFDDAYKYTVNPADARNYWYLMSLNETEKYNININYNPDIKETNLWINAPVFNKEKKPIGLVGTSFDLATFVESIYNNYFGDATLYFFNKAGEITGASNTNIVTDKIQIDNLLGKTGEKIYKYAENNSTGRIESFVSHDGIVAVGAVPLLDWYVTVIQPINVKDYLRTDVILVFLAMVFGIAFLFIMFNVLS